MIRHYVVINMTDLTTEIIEASLNKKIDKVLESDQVALVIPDISNHLFISYFKYTPESLKLEIEKMFYMNEDDEEVYNGHKIPSTIYSATLIKRTPFQSSKLEDGRDSKIRVHGVSQTIVAGETEKIKFDNPYDQAKWDEIGVSMAKGCTLSLGVEDDDTGFFTGTPNSLIDQFAFDVGLGSDDFFYACRFSANVYEDMVLFAEITNLTNSDLNITVNFPLHEVIDEILMGEDPEIRPSFDGIDALSLNAVRGDEIGELTASGATAPYTYEILNDDNDLFQLNGSTLEYQRAPIASDNPTTITINAIDADGYDDELKLDFTVIVFETTKSLSFTNGHLTIAKNEAFDFGDEMTLFVRFKALRGADAIPMLFGQGNQVNAGMPFKIWLHGGNTLYTKIYSDTTSVQSSIGAVVDDTWMSAVIKTSATEAKIYLDGVFVKSFTPVSPLKVGEYDINIGAIAEVYSVYTGKILEVGFYKEALSDSECINLSVGASDLSVKPSYTSLTGWWRVGENLISDGSGGFKVINEGSVVGADAIAVGITLDDVIVDVP